MLLSVAFRFSSVMLFSVLLFCGVILWVELGIYLTLFFFTLLQKDNFPNLWILVLLCLLCWSLLERKYFLLVNLVRSRVLVSFLSHLKVWTLIYLLDKASLFLVTLRLIYLKIGLYLTRTALLLSFLFNLTLDLGLDLDLGLIILIFGTAFFINRNFLE